MPCLHLSLSQPLKFSWAYELLPIVGRLDRFLKNLNGHILAVERKSCWIMSPLEHGRTRWQQHPQRQSPPQFIACLPCSKCWLVLDAAVLISLCPLCTPVTWRRNEPKGASTVIRALLLREGTRVKMDLKCVFHCDPLALVTRPSPFSGQVSSLLSGTEVSSQRVRLGQGLCALARLTLWAGWSFVVVAGGDRGCPGPCRMFGSLPWLQPTRCQYSTFPGVTTKKCPQTLPNVLWGGKLLPLENSWSRCLCFVV